MNLTNEIDLGLWIERTGWPTRKHDVMEMARIYHQWIMTSKRVGLNKNLDSDGLITTTLKRMKLIHGDTADAYAITGLLTLEMAKLATIENINVPTLTNLLH